MRLLRITGVDLNHFEFDWDLTWAAFFMNASGEVYGRFGGRDAQGPDTRNTLEGLRFAMQAAHKRHQESSNATPRKRDKAEHGKAAHGKPLFIEKLPVARNVKGCIHCHQAKELLRLHDMQAGTWRIENVFTYPLPENLGLLLDPKQGNRIVAIQTESQAAKAGLVAGDILESMNHLPIYSFADAQYALHRAPAEGKLALVFHRSDQRKKAQITLEQGWRRTNITWRPSLLDLLSTLTIYGEDLSAQEKQALGLDTKLMAFRQENPVHPRALAIGVRAGDIFLGVNGKRMPMTVDQFLGYMRRNFIVGETVAFNLIRAGKKMDLKVTLK